MRSRIIQRLKSLFPSEFHSLAAQSSGKQYTKQSTNRNLSEKKLEIGVTGHVEMLKKKKLKIYSSARKTLNYQNPYSILFFFFS